MRSYGSRISDDEGKKVVLGDFKSDIRTFLDGFESVWEVGGGPSDAITVYTMLIYLVGMINMRQGEAAAVSVLFLLLLIGLVLVVTGLLQRRGEA